MACYIYICSCARYLYSAQGLIQRTEVNSSKANICQVR